jgi:hypothetical protein
VIGVLAGSPGRGWLELDLSTEADAEAGDGGPRGPLFSVADVFRFCRFFFEPLSLASFLFLGGTLALMAVSVGKAKYLSL